MIKAAGIIFLTFITAFCATAQTDDKNISIKSSTEEYRFEKVSEQNPVVIKSTLTTSYFCNDFRTSFFVSEFYNNQEQLNSVAVIVNGNKVLKPNLTNENYHSEGIFYSDSKVCYFNLPLEKKGTTSTVTFKKTILDPRYFTNIFFTESYAIEDIVPVKAATDEITKGITGDINKVKAIFKWVQDNIRYIAFEDGIAGFKADIAQEVLRKKYGDCKGMANLTTQMLRAINLDARMCWIGTNHIAYNYSTPSLSVDNHCIAAWLYYGKIYFLDATEKYIGFNEIAERIQGRQILIEDGDKYLLKEVPVSDPLQNTCIEKRVLRIEGNSLIGKVTQTWKGESKEWLLSSLNSIKKEKQEDALKQYLNDGNNNYQINNLNIINLNNYNEDIKIEYELTVTNALASFNKESYIDLDNRKEYEHMKIDQSKHQFPYEFPYKDHIILEVELQRN